MQQEVRKSRRLTMEKFRKKKEAYLLNLMEKGCCEVKWDACK